jgi:galactokinase
VESPYQLTNLMKNPQTEHLRVSTPGRVCLFGEHQDYLHLPVIPCAISLRVTLEGHRRDDLQVNLDLPDIDARESFALNGILPYTVERDYFRSAVNVLLKRGLTFSRGFDGRIHGEIPINAGTSSSSALIVTWINFLARMSDQAEELPGEDIAVLAHQAEVVEFGEPGGMMDHFSTACGGIMQIDFHPVVRVIPLAARLGAFVLGDSGEPKDTKEILARVKNRVIDIQHKLSSRHHGFSLHTVLLESLDRFAPELNREQLELLYGTINNRDLTRRAREVLERTPLDHRLVGELLNEHQTVLREILKISTPKIDRMIEAANRAGAFGGKINGSGGGGCMFVYAPENTREVAEAIEKAGGKAYIIRPDEGTRAEVLQVQD